MKKVSSKSKQVLKNRTKLEWILFIMLLIILYLLLAMRFGWWPWSTVKEPNLGTAFYPVSSKKTNSSSSDSGGGSTSTGSSGSNGSSSGSSNGGGSGSGGGNNNGGGSGGGGGTTSGSSALLTFSAGLNQGDTKQDVSGRASGLDEHCTIVVQSSSVGKQEVCTYTEGDKIVTVTYLDDHVVSASRSGF